MFIFVPKCYNTLFMKKFYSILFVFLMAFSACTLTSCFGDEEEEELVDETTMEQFRKDIVGTWRMDGTDEYFVFRVDGSGSKANSSHGDYWDSSETDISQGDEPDHFEWYIEQNGLMIIHGVLGDYNDPDPDAPFTIKSITGKKMTWVTSGGTQQTLSRQ